MSYLGRGLEQVDNISKLDNITFNGGTTYALTKDSAAFTPISSNALLVSIDGVIQQGNFSVSGTNIVFNFSPTSSNTCDFIMHYGTGVAFTPADNSITKDKTNFVSTSSSAGLEIKGDGTTDGYIQLNCSQGSHGIKLKSPNHASSSSYTLTFPATDPAANKILQTDGSGNLSFVDAPSGGFVRLGGTTGTGLSNMTHDNIFTSTYEVYKIIGSHNMGTNNAETRMVVRKSGTDYEDNYRLGMKSVERTSSQNQDSNKGFWDHSVIRLTTGSSYTSSHPTAMELTVYNPKDGTRNTCIQFRVSYYRPNEDTWYALTTGGIWVDGSDGQNNDGFKIYPSTGTLDNLKYSIYGLVSS